MLNRNAARRTLASNPRVRVPEYRKPFWRGLAVEEASAKLEAEAGADLLAAGLLPPALVNAYRATLRPEASGPLARAEGVAVDGDGREIATREDGSVYTPFPPVWHATPDADGEPPTGDPGERFDVRSDALAKLAEHASPCSHHPLDCQCHGCDGCDWEGWV